MHFIPLYSRVFYETLLRQRPDSIMAKDWCLAYGVMEESVAKKEYKAQIKRKEAGKSSAGSKSPPPPAAKSGSKKTGSKKKKKRKLEDDVAYDAGMDAGGDEGIGVAAL